MKIVVGSDHAGFPLKAELVAFIRQSGHDVTDVGSYDPNPVDFPDIARKVAAAITGGQAERGLMVCGTGVGAAIGANKMKGIRAAVCHDVHSAHQSVEHDDVNVMCIGARRSSAPGSPRTWSRRISMRSSRRMRSSGGGWRSSRRWMRGGRDGLCVRNRP